MKYFVNLITAGALICAVCLTSCKDDENGGDDTSVRTVVPTRSTVNILEGSTTTIAATVAPGGADQRITWTSENTNIATVTGKGEIDGISASSVTGLSLGSTTVTATSVSDPSKKATIQVSVITRIDSVMVDIDSVTFVMGATETATVAATVAPAHAAQTIIWTSSNTNVATVSNGVIRAVGIGVATITAASALDETKKATTMVEIVSLDNKVIHIASKFGNGLSVNWADLYGDLVEFFYTNDADQSESTIVPVTKESSHIPGFASAPLSFRTLYLIAGGKDTLRAPLVDFKGSIYDFAYYIRSSPTENVIKACDFDLGGEGIGFHDADNQNAENNYRRERGDTNSDVVEIEANGRSIGYIHNGFWVNYTVNVLDAGNYEIDFHVSVYNSGARCRIETDGELSDEYPMDSNGTYADWRYYCEFHRIDPPKFYLTKGRHTIKFYSMGGNYNLNGIRLTYKP
jgi:hypothetical protein